MKAGSACMESRVAILYYFHSTRQAVAGQKSSCCSTSCTKALEPAWLQYSCPVSYTHLRAHETEADL
eukprot:6403865-Amphidinium_carterae.3